MTVSVSNTNLNDSFNAWRLNTNFVATVVSNNVVTVSRAGSANRGGVAKGNGHVAGTFTANELRTTTLRSGNTSDNGGWLYVNSNTSINATSLTVTANTTFQGNVNFTTSGTDRVILGDISRVRVTGGTRGQFLRIEGSTDTPNFKSLSLRDIADLSTNSASIILSAANTTFSDNGDSPQLKFAGINDTISVYLAADVVGDSDLHVTLADASGDSTFAVTDSSNTIVGYIDSVGNIVAKTAFLPTSDDTVDLGASGAEFKDAYIDGVAYIDELSMGTAAGQGVATSLIPKTDAAGNLGSTTRKWGTVWADTTNGGAGVFNTVGVSSTLTVNGIATFNGDMTINSDNFTLAGNTVVGDASTDTVTFNAQVDSDFDPQTGSQRDMGSTLNRWHNVYANNAFANNITVDNDVVVNNDATIQGNLTVNGTTIIASGQAFEADDGVFNTLGVTGTLTANGNVDLGNAITDSITVTGQFDSSLIPISDDQYDLGTATKQWQDIWIDGTASIDTLTVDVDSTLGGHRATVSGNVHINDTVILTNGIKDGATTVISKNGKLHANNTITNGTLTSAMLANTMTSGSSVGSGTAIPVLSFNNKGQITGYGTSSVSGVTGIDYTQSNNVISVSTSTTTFKAPIDAAGTTSGSTRGVASFDSGDFSLTDGHVTLKDATTGAVLAISGTAKEVDVSRTNGTVTIGLPSDVKIADDLFVGGGLRVTGNLVVSGTTTTVDTETVLISDNIITLNSNFTGNPAVSPENAGISVERGTGTNYQLVWNETNDHWEVNGQTYAGRLVTTGDTAAGGALANYMTVANTETLASARLGATASVTLTGDVTGTASFSGNSVSIATTYNNDVVLGTDTSGNYMVGVTAGDLIDVTHTPGEGSTATINVDLSELTDMTAAMVSTDEFVVLDASAQRRKQASEIPLSVFNRTDQIALGTHTTGNYMAGVTAGAGIGITHTPGEGSSATIAIDSDLRGDAWVIGPNSSDYLNIDGTANAHRFYLDGTEDMRLSNDGQLDVGGSVVAHSSGISDINLKENIEKVTDAISKVQQLNGYTFNYKKDGRAGAGIIAQEVEEVLPSAVHRTEILGYDGEYLVVEYDQLTALLIESIKELKAEIDELKKNK